ncbi:hypothetical protein [Shewanella sp. SR44-3]|uniref:hypothetical protein n=1 Tax=Shewanella sp. SR44-3 TaxID=2760936 RepID=UPI0015FC4982|nr:hypothetical protein [Shewanella sp. SR44-3]MBB1268947.1 hypothetical protein [Shewanella sp. SR44-3]
MSKEYNQVYEKLVKNQNDFTGMIAYCIYKHEKRLWILKGEDAEQFVKLKLQPHEIKKYKTQADSLLTIAYQANADEEIERIQQSLAQEMINFAKKTKFEGKFSRLCSWHNSGTSGIVGNFYTGAVVAVLAWIFSSPEAWSNVVDSALATVKQFWHAL